MNLIVGLLLLASGFVLVAGALAFGAWAVYPVDRAAKGRRHPPQFSLVDFLCLFVLIQLPTGLIHGLLEAEEYAAICILDVFGWGACGAMWWVSVRTLSQAGVSNPRHRAVFLLVALPIAVFGSMTIPVILLVIAALVAGEMQATGGAVGILVGVEAALLVAVYGCGRYTRWMLSAVPGRGPVAPSERSSKSAGQQRIGEDPYGGLPTEPTVD